MSIFSYYFFMDNCNSIVNMKSTLLILLLNPWNYVVWTLFLHIVCEKLTLLTYLSCLMGISWSVIDLNLLFKISNVDLSKIILFISKLYEWYGIGTMMLLNIFLAMYFCPMIAYNTTAAEFICGKNILLHIANTSE
jgi:hypothetical protein